MEPKIANFSRESFRYAMPHLKVSPAGLTIDVQTGNTVTGSFLLESESGKDEEIRAYITVHDCYMSLNTESFAASKKLVSWIFDAGTLAAGTSYSGYISVISDHGETEIPYNVNVTEKSVITDEGEISDLFQFSAFAMKHFNKAAEIFCDNSFKGIFLEGKEHERNLWQSLRNDPDHEHALDTFLCADRKKFPVRLFTEKNRYEFHLSERPIEDKILLEKSTWGWCGARIKTYGDFIECEKNIINSDDFDEDTCEIKFQVNPLCTSAVRDSGKIVIENALDRIEIRIDLINVTRNDHFFQTKKRRFQNYKKAVLSYANLKMGEIEIDEAMAEIRSCLYGIDPEGRDSLGELVEIYLEGLSGKKDSASERFLEVEKNGINIGLYDFIEYLLTEDEEVRKKDIDEVYDLACTGIKWQDTLLYINMDRKIANDPARKIEELSKLYDKGIRSPFIYIDTLLTFRNEVDAFKSLGGLEKHAFAYAARHEYFTDPDLVEKYVCFATEIKEYDPLILSTLCYIYDILTTEEVLFAIDTQIILRGYQKREDHKFLTEGVKEGLRITGIYEAYFSTFNAKEEELLPETFMYFRYDDPAAVSDKAKLFAYIVDHKDDGENYRFFVNRIRDFAGEELKKGNVSDDLITIYRDCIKDHDFLSANAEYLVNVLFKARIFLMDGNFSKIKVFPDELKDPDEYMLQGRINYVDVYGDDSIVMLADDEERLYPLENCGDLTKQFTPAAHLDECLNSGSRDIRLLCETVYESEKLHRNISDKIGVFTDILKSNRLSEGFKLFIAGRMINHYYDTYDGVMLEKLLSVYDLYGVDRKDGENQARLILTRNMYPLGIRAVKYLGPENVEAKFILRIVEQMLDDEKGRDSSFLDAMAYFLMKEKKASDKVLIWLREHHEGSLTEMTELFEILNEKGLMTEDYSAKLIEQILFTEELPAITGEIYKAYDHKSDDILARAMINYVSYRYLLCDREPESEFVSGIRDLALDGNDRLHVLTYLKILSSKNTLTSSEREFTLVMLARLTEEGVILPFFKRFIGKCDVPAEIINRTFVLFTADEEANVSIHYRTYTRSRTEASYTTEYMRNIYKGLFIKEFLIFDDENVQYYITIDDEEEKSERVAESGLLEFLPSDSMIDDGGSLFTQLNSVFIAEDFSDGTSFKEYLLKYIVDKNMIGDLFKVSMSETEETGDTGNE